MTQAPRPTPGKPLDQDSVKLLLPGDVLECLIPREGDLLKGEHRFNRTNFSGTGLYLEGDGREWAAGRFTFVARPTPVGGDQEARPSPAASGWRPIETAPKDGTWFDAWRAPSKTSGSYWEPRITVRWDEEGEEWVWPDNTYEAFTEIGIERANAAIADCEMYADKTFTHWMPLPPPPAIPDDQGAGA